MEEINSVNIRHWGFCPFRGQPHISLDSRCPTTLRVITDPVDTKMRPEITEDAPKRKRGRPKKDEVRIIPVVQPIEVMAHLSPIMEEESYCHQCLTQRVREREMGVAFSIRKASTAPIGEIKRRRGRPRKVA